MQFLRNITWWVIGLSTLLVFVLVVLLSEILAGQFWEVPWPAIVCVYVGIALGFINKINFLRLGETLVHEIGHAQMAALTFGQVSFIRVERDTSGVTYHRQGFLFRRFSSGLISLFGPIFNAVLFVITARFVASELTAYWAIGLSFFVFLILVTTVRNFWGWVTGLFLLGVLYLILETSGLISPQIVSTANLATTNDVLVNVILSITAFNAGSALRYSINCLAPKNPNSDEYKFSKALFLPIKLGGMIIFVIQILIIWVGLSYLLGWSEVFKIGRFI
jgi:hypothetical protein